MKSDVRTLLETGRLEPVVDRRQPLSDVVGAHRYVEAGRRIGNVVLEVDPAARGAARRAQSVAKQ